MSEGGGGGESHAQQPVDGGRGAGAFYSVRVHPPLCSEGGWRLRLAAG